MRLSIQIALTGALIASGTAAHAPADERVASWATFGA